MRAAGRHIALMVVLLLSAALAGCASSQRQVGQAGALGDAGVAFADAMPKLYDAFFLLAVQVDSLELAQQRPAERDTEVLLQALDDSNADFKNTIGIIGDLKRHNMLLKSYFVAFRDLASAETGGEIPGAAKKAVENLSAVGTQITGENFLGNNLSTLIEPVAAYAVTVAKAAALRAEFEARGAVINREIAIQEEAISIVAQRMIADRERILIETTGNPLTEEFTTNFDRPLADDWWRRRADYLKLVIEVDEVTRAESAVRNLRIAWESMAAGRDQAATVDDILADLAAVTAFSEKVIALQE
jgi:hypothetical protein